MKGPSLALLGVLVVLHWRAGDGATALPLSMFRDGKHASLGYSAFALLILLGAVMAHAAYRCGEFATSLVYAAAIVMLVAIAVTPSVAPFHILISLLLPLMFHAFYLRMLHSVLSAWVVLHLLVPVLLLFAVQFHSFGAWQKSMMMYFVLLANLHYGLLPHTARKKVGNQSIANMNRDVERLIAEGWIDRKCALPGQLREAATRK